VCLLLLLLRRQRMMLLLLCILDYVISLVQFPVK
jgi:hypothetical protein